MEKPVQTSVGIRATATVGGRHRRTVAPTPSGVRGGAVPADGFTLDPDSACTGNP